MVIRIASGRRRGSLARIRHAWRGVPGINSTESEGAHRQPALVIPANWPAIRSKGHTCSSGGRFGHPLQGILLFLLIRRNDFEPLLLFARRALPLGAARAGTAMARIRVGTTVFRVPLRRFICVTSNKKVGGGIESR